MKTRIKKQQKLKLKILIQIIRKRFVDADISDSSSVVAYYLLLSMLPFILMLGSVITLFNVKAQIIIPYLKEIFPTNIYHSIEKPITHLLTSHPEGALFIFSAIMTTWAVSRGVSGLQRVLNRIYGIDDNQNFIIRRLLSFGLTFIFFITLFLMAIIISFGNNILNYLQQIFNFDIKFVTLFVTLKWPVTFISMFIFVLILYTIIPNAKISIKRALPGSIFTTIGWLLIAQIFSFFTQHLVQKYHSYGLIGTMIIVILWLKITSIIICIGALMNSVITEYKQDIKNKKEISFK